MPAFAQVTTPAPAESSAGQGTTEQTSTVEVGDIVVTANRREQRTQSIGIAVSAYSGETLTRSGIASTTDLGAITPGLAITLVTPGQPALIAIRGISQSNYAGQLESTNAYYIDDNYQVLSSTNSQGLYDVSRVETLKGPQGTLFGRNANGGLVNIITNSPDNAFGGYAQIGLASRGEVRAEGAVNVPLTETVAGRIAVYRNHFDGAYKNQVPNVRNLGDEDAFGVRGKLKLTAPDSRLTVLLSGSYYKQFSKSGGQALPTPAAPTSPEGLGELTGPGTTQFNGYRDADGDPFTIAVDYPGNHGQRVYDGGLKVNYDLGGDITLISQSYYQHARTYYGEDNDLSPLNFSIYQVFNKSRSFTQEVRLIESTGRFRWTAGAFYLHVRGNYTQNFELRGFGEITRSDYYLKTDSESIFGQVEYDVTPKVTLIGGGRFIIDHKNYGIDYKCLTISPTFGAAAGSAPAEKCTAFASSDPLALINNPTYRDTHTEHGFAGRAQVNWKPIDGLLVYASYNRGYKAFNYNEAFAGATPVDRIRFNGEKVNAYEVGEKWDLLDNRVRLNSAFFYYDFNGYQAFDQRGLLFTVFNSPAQIYGGEAEVTVRPGSGWTLNASALLLHTRVDDVPLPKLVTSRRTAQSPNWAYTFSIAKTLDLPIGAFEATFNGTYTGSQYAQLQNSPITLLPAAFNANARIAFVPTGSNFQLAVFSRNITNNRKPNYAFDLSGGALGFREQSFPDPRVIGAEFRVKF